MASKFKIDVAKIKEERKQHALKLEIYNKLKAKSKKVQQVVKFDELKQFKALEEIAHEPSIPVEEYGDPVGLSIIDIEQYQCIWNATSAFKRTTQRKGQSNIKISNILKFNDYIKDEKQSIGLNLLNLMSISPENTAECMHVLDSWVFEWQPTFLQICVLLENLGVDIRKELDKNFFIPEDYQKTLESTKIEYDEFNYKASSTKQSELSSNCLSNVFTYIKSIIGYLNQDELQSLLILLSSLSLDKNCVQFKEIFNELLNKCFGCLENKLFDKVLKFLYLKIENSMYQCYFVNKILYPCSDHCKSFTMELSYLFMCNLLYNHDLTLTTTSPNNSNNNDIDTKNNLNDIRVQMELRSKRKIVEDKIEEVRPSPKKLQLSKENTALKKVQCSIGNYSENKFKCALSPKNAQAGMASIFKREHKIIECPKPTSKPSKKSKRKHQRDSEDPKQVQRSILDFLKRRDKSPDLSKSSCSQVSVPSPQKVIKEDAENTENIKMEIRQDPQIQSEENVTNLDSIEEDLTPNIDAFIPPGCDQREIVFIRYKTSGSITFPMLLQRIRKNLQDHLNCPIRVYRIVNLLNNIVQLLVIDESNMSLCKLVMQELSHVQYKYYGLHDIHRHLVCVYLQQYTTMWTTAINRIQYRINQRNEEADSE